MKLIKNQSDLQTFTGSIGIDWRKLGPADPGHWSLVFSEQMGNGHCLFDEINRFVNGPNCHQRVILWFLEVDDICIRNSTPFHEEAEFDQMGFHDGFLSIHCSKDKNNIWWQKTIRMMEAAFLPYFFVESGCTIQIDLRAIKYKDKEVVV